MNVYGAISMFAVALLLIVTPARAADEAGTLIGVEGKVELGRAGAWQAAGVGSAVNVGDQIRTGEPGRARVAFLDGSTINIGDGSLFTIDEHVFDPDQNKFSTYLRLLKGKVRALVSEYYEDPLATYELETATAVSGVRGTEFIVTYDAADDATEVVGLSGRVAVHSVKDRAANGVFIKAGQATTIMKGAFPTPPRHVGAAQMRGYIEGLKFIGGGSSMLLDDPVLQGGEVPRQEQRAGGSTTGPVTVTPPQVEPPSKDERSTPGDVADQPPAAVDEPGQVVVPF